MNELVLKETQVGEEKIYSLFLWNEGNRAFSKIVESNNIQKLAYNLYLVRKGKEYPKLYTIINNRLESRILQTANVSYLFGIVYYQKGEDWFCINGLEEIHLGEMVLSNGVYENYHNDINVLISILDKFMFFLNHKKKMIYLLKNDRKIIAIPNPYNEYHLRKRNFEMFVKNENGLFDCYSFGDHVTKPIIKWEYDDKGNLYLWDKDRLAWHQFSEFRHVADNALSKNHVENKKLYMELYKLNEKFEPTFVAKGFAKYYDSGIFVGKTFFPYIPNTQNLDFEHPKTGFVQKLKNLFH